jgi:quercetin dioxygenase-like cupin family protein
VKLGILQKMLKASPLATVSAANPAAASGAAVYVNSGGDRFGETRNMGVSTIGFKIVTADAGGRLFMLEQMSVRKGGPPRHVHPEQDEWFYVVAGEYVVEVGQARYQLSAGDSLLAPRGVPHVWAFVGETPGRMLVGFTPAGKMEDFFREVTKTNAMPTQDPKMWLEHGMQVVGPPLHI